MLAAACPPLNLYPLAWIGLLPLFYSLEHTDGSGFQEGSAAGLVFNLAILHWLAFNTGTYLWVAVLTMAAASLILSMAWGTAAWLFCRMRDRLGGIAWFFVPFSWCAWEGWLGHLGELAFPWPLLALTQSAFSPALQIMEFTGVWGTTFWVVALNTAIYVVWRNFDRRSKRYAMATVGALVLIALGAYLHARRFTAMSGQTARVAVVQGNIPADEKWIRGIRFSWDVYDSLTSIAVKDSVDLIVWPETALPAYLLHQSIFADRFANLADRSQASILTGASDYCYREGERRLLNSCMLVRPGDWIAQRGAKRDLVPFGERVPFQRICPKLGELNLGQAEFIPGYYAQLYRTRTSEGFELKFPAMICYESIFPWQSRQAVIDGANLLMTISNDAWYGWSLEAWQIVALSRFRCIETRRSMARASNSGISFLCDPSGTVVKSTRLFEPAWITASLPIMNVETLYVKFGDWLLFGVTAIYGLGLVYAALIRKD
jgi:apolipoprotein N-acyltransferase